LDDDSSEPLTRDMTYICEVMGLKLPVLPVHGEEECKLFARLTLSGLTKERQMVLEWCKYVDGINIFPKLPVHLRTHGERFERNERVRQATKDAKKKIALLKELNDALCPAIEDCLTDLIQEPAWPRVYLPLPPTPIILTDKSWRVH